MISPVRDLTLAFFNLIQRSPISTHHQLAYDLSSTYDLCTIATLVVIPIDPFSLFRLRFRFRCFDCDLFHLVLFRHRASPGRLGSEARWRLDGSGGLKAEPALDGHREQRRNTCAKLLAGKLAIKNSHHGIPPSCLVLFNHRDDQ